MKTLKNNKILASGMMLILAIAMMASASYAWFVLEGTTGNPDFAAGALGLDVDIDVYDSDIYDLEYFDGPEKLQPGFYYGIDELTYMTLGTQLMLDKDGKFDLTLDDDENHMIDANKNDINDLHWGHIKNTGNLVTMVKLSLDGTFEVVRKNAYDKDSTSINDNVFPSADYAGVKGAVTYNMIIPNTENNKEMINNSDVQFYTYKRENAETKDYDTEYYVLMYPNATLDVSTYIDMATNAGYDVKGDSTKHDPASLYLDNSYFGCKINANMKWIATQYNSGRAMADVFGIKCDNAEEIMFKFDTADNLNDTITKDNNCFILNLG